VPAAQVCAFPQEAERTFMNDTVVFYHGERVSVPKEVAEFLEQDRKCAQAEARQDKRHLSRSESETVLSSHVPAGRPVERSAFEALQLENLRNAIAELSDQEQQMLSLRYDGELTMEEIGKVFGVSKMAVSKRLKKLHEKLRSSVI